MKRTVVRVSLGSKISGGVTYAADGWIIAIPPNVHGAAEREVLIAVDTLIEELEAGRSAPCTGMDVMPPRRRATDLRVVAQCDGTTQRSTA